ncbi:ABC transporter permease [Chryseolinea sp. T2]|uniref:ABC transporter permease n=1 Tax=Chryseolinea sp. T2 TaxID=3129255 RepID=UPI003076C0B9
MIRHNLIVILRNFGKYKSTFVINLLGLSTGLACAILIALWVTDEYQMDKFHELDSRLYRVLVDNKLDGKLETSSTTQAILGDALQAEVPEVEKAVTTLGGGFDLTVANGETHQMGKASMVDANFLQIFSYDLLAGRKDALNDKKNIVLSESSAKALFGNAEDALGKLVQWEHPHGKGESIVAAVMKNISPRSSFHADYLLSFEIFKDIVGPQDLHWGNFGCNTFLVLKPNADAATVSSKIAGFVKKKAPDSRITLQLAPYADYYLHNEYVEGRPSGGRIEYVRLFSLIGIVIVALACINFMNLATARATRRLREVGVRKAIGAGRTSLTLQYLSESMLMSVLSVVIAVLMADLLMPVFNQITGKNLALHASPMLFAFLGCITILTGLLSGFYPAIYLSRFSPAVVLKGKLAGAGSTMLHSAAELFARKGLIVFQFIISIVFIVAVWVIYKQIDFVQHKNLGYDKDQLIYIKPEAYTLSHMDAFLNEASRVEGVADASSIARTIIGSRASTVGYFNWEGKDPDAQIPFEIVNCNYGLIETLGVEMAQGRTFSREHSMDSSAIILNEAAIRVMNMKDPLGKIFNLWGKELTIIGVAKDFHFQSLHEKVTPLFFRLAPGEVEQILVRLERGKEHEALEGLEQLYKQTNPGFAFVYTFLSKDYEAQYVAEQRVGVLSGYFATLAIIISCLGLFGLAAFTAERRLKEIGIRKVLGSGEWRIIYLLSADFSKIVLLSSAIALPIAFVITRSWLSGFAYKIELSWWYFPVAAATALLIALLTVGVQAVKASRVNPVQCLKEE